MFSGAFLLREFNSQPQTSGYLFVVKVGIPQYRVIGQGPPVIEMNVVFHVDNCLDGVPGSINRADYAFRYHRPATDKDLC